MAYFGRTPKKPGSVPGSQSGFQQERTVARAQRILGALADRGHAQRPGRANRAVRASVAVRSARGAR